MKLLVLKIIILQIIIVINGEEKKGLIGRLIPQPVIKIITPKFLLEKAQIKNGFLTKTFIVKNNKEEEGSLGFLGRDLVNGFAKVTSKIANFANPNVLLNHTIGLDTNMTFFKGSSDALKNHIKAIFPGTKWCGAGDVAKDDTDLGLFESLDKCCREHDQCPNSIPAGETKYGLVNSGTFTRSLCECDWKFYICLKEAKNVPAYQIGYTYFTVLGPQCFKNELQKSGCDLYKIGKCITYQLEQNSTETYQWFDSPPF